MARGARIEKVYTGKAAKVYEKVQKFETDLKSVREELKLAYREQMKVEKLEKQKSVKRRKGKIIKGDSRLWKISG